MSEMKHTPTPWSYDGSQSRTIFGPEHPDHSAPTICDVLDTAEGLEGDDPKAEANAELIVRAVNCHADLLAACEAMLGHGIGGEWPPGAEERWDAAVKRAEAAITKAKGGTAPHPGDAP